MRKVFCQALFNAPPAPGFVFLTGDLGFMALEPLRDAMGDRFINAGVAEQNMVSVGAGLAGPACARGSTASRRSSTPGPSSRSATMSACTACRWCSSATAAAMATA